MIQGSLENINSPVRQIKGKVELLESSTTTNSGEIIRADYVAPYTTIDVKADRANYFDKSKVINATETDTGFSFTWAGTNGAPNSIGKLKDLAPDLKPGDVVTFYADVVNLSLNVSGGFLHLTGSQTNWNANSFHTIIQEDLDGYVYAYGKTDMLCEYNNVIITKIQGKSYTPYIDITGIKPKKNILQVNQLTTPFNEEKPIIFSGSVTGEFVLNCSINCEYTYETAALFEVIVDGVAKYVTPAAIKLQAVHCKFNGTITQIKIMDYCKCAEGSIDNIQLEAGTVATEYEPYTPIPANEIKAYGKNLIPYPYTNSTQTINGITFTDNGDGTITANGTATANAIYYFASYSSNPISVPKATYTMSGAPVGSTYNTYYLGIAGNKDGNALERATYDNGLYIELDTIRAFYAVVKSDVTVNNLVFKPQLELGKSATEYEAYKEPTIYPLTTTELEITPYCHGTTLIASSGVVMDITFENVNPKVEYTYEDALQAITLTRIPDEAKFYGFGISQKLNVKLRDIYRNINITTANGFKAYFAAGDDEYINNFPSFYVTETNRDENTNELSITAYDCLYAAAAHQISEIQLTSYTILEMMEAIATVMGLELDLRGDDVNPVYHTSYEDGANLEGTESFREVLDDLAEATQTIYYISGDRLVFRSFDRQGWPVLEIGKQDYITLKSKENRRLSVITHATELGDNVSASIGVSGSTQYIRDNVFWELREDIADLVDHALSAIGGLTIGQFDMTWRGNYLLEPGDKIGIINKDGSMLISYLLNDVIEYNGALSETTSWNYQDNSEESVSNPTTLGEVLKQTYARVDKQNKEIQLLASETADNFSELNLTTGEIKASVSSNKEYIDSTNEAVNNLMKKVSTTITEDQLQVAIQTELENGVNSVTTSTGFTFNEEGLTVLKTNSEISTTITEDGMTVKKGSDDVLTANNEGVKAIDLHATTYLIIGKYSRFEDMKDSNRTACFWIGG